MTTQLSEHFSLEELTFTQHRNIDNTPNAEQLANLKDRLAPKLEEVRGIVGPMHVNSGFRSEALNKSVGGAKNSSHVLGLACDFVPLNHTLKDAIALLLKSDLVYQQIILEFFEPGYPGGWIHIAAPKVGEIAKKQALMIGKWTNNKYLPYDPSKIP
jgi:hypothetical protein